jgi:23S rRNA (guanine2445-N2)-methyltransferase / 23S rRNA (guanine2069-N7)-methyltransferase
VACVLAPGGVAVFSCNLRNFKLDTAALAALGLDVQDITAQTIPEDFQRNPKIHKCFVVRRAGQV